MGFLKTSLNRLGLVLSVTGVITLVCPWAFSSPIVSVPLWKKPGAPHDQFAARVTPLGLQSLLKAVLDKYSETGAPGNRAGFTIPKTATKSVVTFSKEKYAALISLSQEFFELDFATGVPLYTRTSAVQLSANVAPSDIKLTPVTTDANGFDADLSVKITDFSATVPVISVCDRVDCDSKQGLRMDLKGISISQSAQSVPILLKARVSCRLENGILKFNILKLSSNLEAVRAPVMNVAFQQILLPTISIESEGHSVTLDTSQLKVEIQKHSAEIGTAIVHSASNYFAGDLALVVNNLLSQESLDASVQENYIKAPQPLWPNFSTPESSDPLQSVLSEVQQSTSSAHFDAGLSGINFGENGILDTSFQLGLNLNGKLMTPSAQLERCSQKSVMGPLKFETAPAADAYGFATAISEPLVNAALKLANSTGLVAQVMKGLSGMEGITLGPDGLKVLFVRKDQQPKIIAILSLDVDISKRPSTGFWAGMKQDIGILLEKTLGAGGHLVFPLQIEIEPSLKIDPVSGETVLSLRTINPVHQTSLENTYGCQSNLSQVTSTVRNSFLQTLTSSFKDVLGKTQTIPISGWIKNTGVHFTPTKVDVESSGHLVIYGNLEKIDWKKLAP